MKQIKEILNKVYDDEELRNTIVPLFISSPGLGKTNMIEQFVKERNVQLVEIITSQISPYEVSGLIMPDKDTKKMMYYDFDRIDNLADGDVLFFDELLQGNPSVLSACLTLIESRRTVSGKALPKVMIIAAANPQGQTPLTPAIKERFIWFETFFDAPIWIKYMSDKYRITNSIGNKLSQLIKKEDFIGNNFNTPRSIDKAVNMVIKDVPTPYYDRIFPILSELITNDNEETVELSEGLELAPKESISWLELIKHKNKLKNK